VACSSNRAARFGALVLVVALAGVAWAKASVDGVSPLAKKLCSEDGRMRAAAERDLLAMGPEAVAPLLEILSRGDDVQKMAIRELLPRYGPEAIEFLGEAGSRDLGGMDRRVMWNAAAEAVARMGEPAIPIVMERFKNPGALFTFATQVLALMQQRDHSATPLLVPLLDSPTKEERQEAAALLANFPDPRAYDALIKALKSDDPVVRMYSGLGLGRIGNRQAVESLIGKLNDPVIEVREAAIGALGQMYEPRFRTRFGVVARTDPEHSVRNVAASWLLRTRDPLAIRLGRRYKPISIDPVRELWIEIRYFLTLAVTFVVLSLLALACVAIGSRFRVAIRWVPVAVGASALAVFGFFWGGLLPQVSGNVEYVLLLLVAPAAVGATYLAAYGMSLDLRGLAGPVAFGAFYLGYGAGWLWLWGYLGF
jgi:HEAT repeat protein